MWVSASHKLWKVLLLFIIYPQLAEDTKVEKC